jgi:rubrerythrin
MRNASPDRAQTRHTCPACPDWVIHGGDRAAVPRDVRPQENPLSHQLNLEVVDADGVIRESAEAAGLDRGDFLRKGALAGGGLIAGSAMFGTFLASAEAAISTTRRSKANDVRILNYALTLEFLEAAFYKQAVANKAYGTSADLKRFAEVVAKHEAEHVSFLRGALGSKAIKSPKFDFGATVTEQAKFAATAQVLEDTGVSAYLGQVKNVFAPGVLSAAGTIATVEARHAAWIRFINAATPAPGNFDKPKSEKAILKAVGATGFIQ